MSFVKVKNISDTNVSFGSFVIEPKNTAVLTKNNYFNTIKTFDEIERIAVEIKEEKSVSILDFGAKGDGVLDSTQFIKNAFEYCSENHITCYVPDGVFRTTGVSISNDLSLECSEFGVILGGLTLNNGAKVFINGVSSTTNLSEVAPHVIVVATNIPDNSITKEKIANGAVDSLKIASTYCPFPVGYVYLSVSSSSPATIFTGTTWERFSQGKALFGVNESDTDFNVSQHAGTKGEKTHKLTVGEMPKHRHNLREGDAAGTTATSDTNFGFVASNGENIKIIDYLVAYNETSGAISDTGGDNAHNNLPPYTTVYMWKRTA